MAKVRLDFTPPGEPDIAKLHIYESPAKDGPYSPVETVTNIGTFPDYISYYSTDLAASATNWFSISWETVAGIEGPQSAPIQGGSTTLVNQIIIRVRERDASLDERVVTQEAEGAIQLAFGNDVDPYDPTLVVSYRQLNGLTYLVMARAYTVQAVTTAGGAIDSATMGLVSFKNTSGAKSTIDVGALIDMANRELGIGTSFVLQLEDIAQQPYITADFSRLVSGWLTIDA